MIPHTIGSPPGARPGDPGSSGGARQARVYAVPTGFDGPGEEWGEGKRDMSVPGRLGGWRRTLEQMTASRFRRRRVRRSGCPTCCLRTRTRLRSAHGFARARCDDRGRGRLIAFGCKGPGICPSCNARRMADVRVHLADRVPTRPPAPHRCVAPTTGLDGSGRRGSSPRRSLLPPRCTERAGSPPGAGGSGSIGARGTVLPARAVEVNLERGEPRAPRHDARRDGRPAARPPRAAADEGSDAGPGLAGRPHPPRRASGTLLRSARVRPRSAPRNGGPRLALLARFPTPLPVARAHFRRAHLPAIDPLRRTSEGEA